MSMPKEILDFYNSGKEVGRLSKGLGRLEFMRLKELMTRYFPAPPAVVFDIGGGGEPQNRFPNYRQKVDLIFWLKSLDVGSSC